MDLPEDKKILFLEICTPLFESTSNTNKSTEKLFGIFFDKMKELDKSKGKNFGGKLVLILSQKLRKRRKKI